MKHMNTFKDSLKEDVEHCLSSCSGPDTLKNNHAEEASSGSHSDLNEKDLHIFVDGNCVDPLFSLWGDVCNIW